MDKKIIGIIAAVIILIAAIVAFGSFGGSTDKVSIGYLPSDHDSALFVANASGMYKDAGIEVELHEYNNGGDLMSAMASGKVDVGYVGITPVLSSIQKGVPVKIVAGAQTEGSGLIASNSNIHSITDLKGKKVATPGEASIQNMLLKYEMKNNGMDASSIESPGMKVASMNDAIKTGSLDAALTYEPFVSIATELNNATLVKKSGDIYPNHPCCVVAVSDKFIKEKPDTVAKIVDIHKQATEKLRNNPEECVQYLPDNIVPDKEVEKGVLEELNWVSDLNDTYKQDIRDFISVEKDLGLINTTFTDEQLFYSK
ncbi:ABC transporter substrate-binding protein [Methanosphaera sp. BMS]|uniref:ABC transporter substrate-binding protein n=1 Tax=Methanosphaera sp. BMS TaxID=1789762 RepID=UPI000DC1DC8D|nr:ABC transporter substrate-binding protein [Methanosphaera sp. BMS]AWX31561.1 nitrate ABC transporter substrate-binding protein [Methanosphaera sp. BMS]